MDNEFATAAFRFGHSMIQGLIQMFATDNTGVINEYLLHKQFESNDMVELNQGEGLGNILAGLVNQPSQSCDKEVTSEVTNFLLPKGQEFGQDLVARNIQRGRDHGLPGFCCYYKLYQDQSFDCDSDWSKRYAGFSTEDWAQLETIYEKPSDIDLNPCFENASLIPPYRGAKKKNPLVGVVRRKTIQFLLLDEYLALGCWIGVVVRDRP